MAAASLGLLLCSGSVALAAPVAQVNTSGLKIALEAGGQGNFRLVLRLASGKPLGSVEPQVLVLENPTRLVVDIPGVASKGSQNLSVKNRYVSAIRIGAHPDKTRIVIDLPGNQAPEFQLEPDGVLHFSLVGSGVTIENDPSIQPEAVPTAEPIAKTGAKPTPTPKGKPTPEAFDAPTPAPTKPAILRATPTATPLRNGEPAAENTPEIDPDIPAVTTASGTGSTVKSIYYQPMNNTTVPAVAFEVDGLNSYSLNKRQPDMYELVLQNAHLGAKHLSLPQFPPDTFKGFSVIVPREEGGNVYVKIYVEENVKLFPFIAKGQLWLKVAQ